MPKPFARGWSTDIIIPEDVDIGARSIACVIMPEDLGTKPVAYVTTLPTKLGIWKQSVLLLERFRRFIKGWYYGVY